MSVNPLNVSPTDGRPFLVASASDLDCEVWARYDAAAELYELCASPDMDDPIGEADDLAGAQAVAAWWFNERRAG